MKYQICAKCIIDTTVPRAMFDEKGICNYCKIHDLLESQFPLNDKGEKKFNKILYGIKAQGENKKYDCVVGLSGGRDSTYALYKAKQLGLRPLAVHFNDGFGNPVAGENMKKCVEKLNVDMRTITSDWRESKDIKIAFLKASTPDLEEGTDLGIAAALYSVAVKENIKYIIIGQSFRTEGIFPLEWVYLDGKYLKSVHNKFGTVKLGKWRSGNAGFNLNVWHVFYYTIIKKIKTIPIYYYMHYDRKEAENLLVRELGWVNTGSHHYDDLYQSLLTYICRVKFGIDRRKINYSALVRSGQMTREESLGRVKEIYGIEDPKIINLCIKRLGITRGDLDGYLAIPPKTFMDYPSHYQIIKMMRVPIKLLSLMNILPGMTYLKYFGFNRALTLKQ